MHIYFSGIGGAGISPLALMAQQAGYEVSGSDKQDSGYLANLHSKGIENIQVGQDYNSIAELHQRKPIDWIVYSSAVIKENPNHPELQFAKDSGVRATKRDEFLQELLEQTGQKLIAVAGTHGKTTTTAMLIWLFKQLGLPLSYSVGGKLSFGGIGEFNRSAEYFVYEADEYDRNFLSFKPYLSIISGIDYDHPDIYPTRENYYEAFHQFIDQSERAVLWQSDADKINVSQNKTITLLEQTTNLDHIHVDGRVNRFNAHVAIVGLEKLDICSYEKGVEIINKFPGVSRRFERISDNIYTDYAHTPEKIRGALQLTEEIAGKNVVVVYEGLHNMRQHFILEDLKTLFAGVKKLYIVPNYRAREDESLEDLTPEKLCNLIQEPAFREPATLDENLRNVITEHVNDGDLVICLTAGGGGSLDEWLRKQDFRR
jgi:UDP-N-acetylmuramate--alanine ligase